MLSSTRSREKIFLSIKVGLRFFLIHPVYDIFRSENTSHLSWTEECLTLALLVMNGGSDGPLGMRWGREFVCLFCADENNYKNSMQGVFCGLDAVCGSGPPKMMRFAVGENKEILPTYSRE